MEKWYRFVLVVAPLTVMVAVYGCSRGGGGSLESTIFGDNLQVLLEYGGIPAVILLFGYLYLRSLMKEYGRQLGQMQEQLNNQQIAMNVLIQNNTKALTRLGTAMMMGCPYIRGHLDAKDVGCGEDDEEGPTKAPD